MSFDLKVTDATLLEPKDGEHKIYIRAEVMARTGAQHEHISKILNADSRVTSTKTGKSLNGLDVIEVLISADDSEINPPKEIVLPSAEDLDVVTHEHELGGEAGS